MKLLSHFTITLISVMLATACSGCVKTVQNSEKNKAPEIAALGSFDADSAYSFVERQVQFGPRVPGTPAHDDCRDYLVQQLRRFGADTVIVQQGKVKAFNGDELPISNIFAAFNSQAPRHVLLVAHYDTRPWADRETKEELRNTPIDGANDGASGVGVILEIARNLAMKAPSVGVDILLVDAEDYGENSKGFDVSTDSWCLGTQYWLENMIPYSNDNLPAYGILLDMVGGRDAQFHYELFSYQNAPAQASKIWSEADALGLDNRFIRSVGGYIVDDHIFLTHGGIPTVDIIESNNIETHSFPPTWHTLNDNMSNIDPSALEDVGVTVLNVLYKEKPF